VLLAAIWLPAYGLEPAANLLTEVADIDLALESFVNELEMKVRADRTTAVIKERVSFADLDRRLALRNGATKERLAAVVQRMGLHVEMGPTIALLRVHDSLHVGPVPPIVVGGSWSLGQDDY
jgi:hypothetical protein